MLVSKTQVKNEENTRIIFKNLKNARKIKNVSETTHSVIRPKYQFKLDHTNLSVG